MNHLKRVLTQELRVCQQTVEGGSSLGDLPSWLACVISALHALLSACMTDNNAITLDVDMANNEVDQQTVLLKQAFRLSLKVNYNIPFCNSLGAINRHD